MTHNFYAAESWALFALGVLHMAATRSRFDAVSSDALWFLSAGVLMVLVAALNLLNRAYGTEAPGLRRVCVAANVVNVGLAVAGGVVGRARVMQWLIVLGIVVPLTVLSAMPRLSRIDKRTGRG